MATSFERLPDVHAEQHFGQKSIITSAEFANFKAYQHALAFTVAGIADKDMLSEIHKAVKGAIDNGTSFNDFKKSLRPFLIAKGYLAPTLGDDEQVNKELLKSYEKNLNKRLKIIYDTNKATAYAGGQWERLQRTKRTFPYLQYCPSLSTNKRDEHKAYYGIVRHIDDPIWQSIFPPNGFGCKCYVKPLTADEARKIGISTDDEVANLPVPDFDSNFDRLGALLRLAEDKHGKEFAEKLGTDLKGEMIGYAKKSDVAVNDFGGIVPRQAEVARLLIDKLDNKPKPNEAMAAEQYQQYHKVKLERPEPVFIDGKPQAGFDYFVTDTGQTLDFMFTMYGYAQVKIDNLNKFFAHNDDTWNTKRKQILDHLEKSDIVPIDLRYLNAENTVKLIAFVVSLPKEQQSQIIFIIGQP